MRFLFASRGTAAACVGLLGLLMAGGGYALALGGSPKTIAACVHRRGGGLYLAKTCVKGDTRISWNKVGPRGPVGPQGPGATSLNFTTAGSASPTPVTIGTAGPLTLTGTCATTGSGASATTEFAVSYTGPALQVDGSVILPDGTAAAYSNSAPAKTTQHLGNVGPTSSHAAEFAQLFVIPSGYSPLQLMVTAVANGGSSGAGATPDTCHLSAVITPVAAPKG